MFGNKQIKAWPYAVAVLLVGTALGAVFAGCTEEPVRPFQDEEQQILKPGLNVYLTLDNDRAPPGTKVRAVAKVRAMGVELTPAGFQIDVLYDPKKLEPAEVVQLEDGVLRAVNLAAAPGLIRAAGASASGIESEVLFVLEMTVKEAGYGETLTLEVKELTVLERNFADVTADVVPAPRAVVVGN